MHQIVLGLGSNLGDRVFYLTSAITMIREELGEIQQVSSLYRADSWGIEELPEYLNQVVVLTSEKDPETSIVILKEIEKKVGRKHRYKWHEREIDIDILYYDDLVFENDVLNIPHPQIQLRKFILMPLVEILPDHVHPVLKQTNSSLLERCEDRLNVEIYSVNEP